MDIISTICLFLISFYMFFQYKIYSKDLDDIGKQKLKESDDKFWPFVHFTSFLLLSYLMLITTIWWAVMGCFMIFIIFFKH
jgi:hypothetical protein